MSHARVTIPIGPASDGTGATPAATTELVSDDQYFLDAIATRWVKEQGRAQFGVTYTLAQLPTGFGGFSKSRGGRKHVDRYMYGHPNGIFRSMTELYPHFLHLQDNGSPIGCPCKLCTRPKSSSKHSGSTTSTPRGGGVQVTKPTNKSQSPPKVTSILKQTLESTTRTRQKQADEEGSEDVYRKLLDRVKEAAPEKINQNFIDQASPDWRAAHDFLEATLARVQESPRFQPRLGELVLFDRTATELEGIAWDSASQAPRRFDLNSQAWLGFPEWQAGVVALFPVEDSSADDLNKVSQTQKHGSTQSGYRIEALTPLSDKEKPISSQHKNTPLHAIRPFSFWKDCVKDPAQAHPTIAHAMKVANSFCIVGKQRFEGQWPNATLFSQGVYIGPELVLVGDAVRLMPNEGQNKVTDVMVISSIRLRFVNLEEASDNDYDENNPYHVCLHINGKAFSLDAKKSFQGGPPVSPAEDGLPAYLAQYGQWYSILDPAKPRSRLEVPFSKVIGRCVEDIAMNAWWSPPGVNLASGKVKTFDLSQGLDTIHEARTISTQNDPRIDKANGKYWFWADSRIEQLDLHEVNDRFVGKRDEERTRPQMHTWRQALRVLDGKKMGVEALQVLQKVRQQQEQQAVETSAAFGMMGGAVQSDSGEEVDMEGLQLGGENYFEGNGDEVENGSSRPGDEAQSGAEEMEMGYDSDVQELAEPQRAIPQVIIDVSSDEDELMAG